MAQAIYLSTAGMLLGWGVETAGAQTGDPNVAPATYKNVQGAKSISEISSEKEQIEVTPLSETQYKQYVGGLADPGGTWEIGFNESNALHTEWDAIVSAYETAKASGLRMWFTVYHPDMQKAFFLVGEPNALGFGGAEVDAVLENNANIMPTGDYLFAAASTTSA